MCAALGIANTPESWAAYVDMVKAELKGESTPVPEGQPPISDVADEATPVTEEALSPTEGPAQTVVPTRELTAAEAFKEWSYGDLLVTIGTDPNLAAALNVALAQEGMSTLPELAANPEAVQRVAKTLGLQRV